MCVFTWLMSLVLKRRHSKACTLITYHQVGRIQCLCVPAIHQRWAPRVQMSSQLNAHTWWPRIMFGERAQNVREGFTSLVRTQLEGLWGGLWCRVPVCENTKVCYGSRNRRAVNGPAYVLYRIILSATPIHPPEHRLMFKS